MSQQANILRVAIPSPLRQLFDYKADPGVLVQPGIRVWVPFGKRKVVGIVVEQVSHSDYPPAQLKSIIDILDETPIISRDLLTLAQWASDYYHHSLGEIFATMLPVKLRRAEKNSIQKLSCENSAALSTVPLSLNVAQQKAVTVINEARGFLSYLLAGITGSGKTEVYLQVIADQLSKGRQALILIPEIALTPQTVNRFQSRFSVPVAVLHSELTDKNRLTAWNQAREGLARIVIGTRSAVFTPMPELGIIIVDEEHDLSFKQQSGFRYSARDLAVKRASLMNIPIVLGSATPSLETLYNVKQGRYQLLPLPDRAGVATLPKIDLIDLREKKLQSGLSEPLIKRLSEHLSRDQQVMLFLNRRGYAPVLLCHDCGWMQCCKRCDARMTLHFHPKKLYCHHCGAQQQPLVICPQCKRSELMDIGVGTEQLENTLQSLFPHKKIVRVDRDTVRNRNSLQEKLTQIHSNEADIIIGTQMLAKGHDIARLTLVAVVDTDGGLFSADFRAVERMSQLLVQVSGRAGRGEIAGEVLIQTHYPENPLLQILLNQGYFAFAEHLLEERERTELPPYSHLALIRAEATSEMEPFQFLEKVKYFLEKKFSEKLRCLGPMPALMLRKAGRYRAQLLLQSHQRPYLQQILKQSIELLGELPLAKKVRWSVDVDPQEM